MKSIDALLVSIFLSTSWNKTYEYKIDKPTFLYLPWIKLHGDKLIDQVNSSSNYEIQPLHLAASMDEKLRQKMSIFSRRFPKVYKRILLEHLRPIAHHLSGFIFTFDWHPSMRILSEVCEALKIERILLLHESVFMDQDKYYYDIKTEVNTPLAEHIICWGALQKDIFSTRGVAEERLHVLGSVKLDRYHHFHPTQEREDFYKACSFDSNKKVILFIMQAMDMQVDELHARAKQLEVIEDLIEYCEGKGCQLLIRTPPAKVQLLSPKFLEKIKNKKYLFCDGLDAYKIGAEDAMYYSDMIISVNSTMLFEGILLHKPVISAKYFEFEQIWDNIDFPKVTHKKELFRAIDRLLLKGLDIGEASWSWAEKNFSHGKFDGKAALRIEHFLEGRVK